MDIDTSAAIAAAAPLPSRLMARVQHLLLEAGHVGAMKAVCDDEMMISKVIEQATDLARFLINESLKGYDGVAVAATPRQFDVLRWTYVRGFARVRSDGTPLQ